MGNNGGFHPFRDANSEFTDPAGSGKPGRSRAGGGTARTAPGGPALRAGSAAPYAERSNPTQVNQRYADMRNITLGYRAKGRGIEGNHGALERFNKKNPQ